MSHMGDVLTKGLKSSEVSGVRPRVPYMYLGLNYVSYR